MNEARVARRTSFTEMRVLTGLRGFAVSPCSEFLSRFDPVSRDEADASVKSLWTTRFGHKRKDGSGRAWLEFAKSG